MKRILTLAVLLAPGSRERRPAAAEIAGVTMPDTDAVEGRP